MAPPALRIQVSEPPQEEGPSRQLRDEPSFTLASEPHSLDNASFTNVWNPSSSRPLVPLPPVDSTAPGGPGPDAGGGGGFGAVGRFLTSLIRCAEHTRAPFAAAP